MKAGYDEDAAVLAYLVGEWDGARPSTADDLDELRALLADPTLWEPAASDLADRVVAAVAVEASTGAWPVTPIAAVAPARAGRRRRRVGIVGIAAASVVVGAVVGVGLTDPAPPRDASSSLPAQALAVSLPAADSPSVALSPREKEALSPADLRELQPDPFSTRSLGRFPGLLYWLEAGPGGSVRLCREIATFYDNAGRANGALRALLNRHPDDTDERSPWPSGSSGDVDLSSVYGGAGAQWPVGTAVVYLNDAALHGGAARDAELAVQQIVWTLTANDSRIRQVVISANDPADRESLQQQGLWRNGRALTEPVRPADPLTVLAPVQLDGPAEGATLSPGVFAVSGAAVSETGRIRWEVLTDGQVYRRGTATTNACCALSPFVFRLTLPPGRWTIRVYPGPDASSEAASRTIQVAGRPT